MRKGIIKAIDFGIHIGGLCAVHNLTGGERTRPDNKARALHFHRRENRRGAWDKLDKVFDEKVTSAQVAGELETYIESLTAKAKALQKDLASVVAASQGSKKE
jgi:hypothetical protein